MFKMAGYTLLSFLTLVALIAATCSNKNAPKGSYGSLENRMGQVPNQMPDGNPWSLNNGPSTAGIGQRIQPNSQTETAHQNSQGTQLSQPTGTSYQDENYRMPNSPQTGAGTTQYVNPLSVHQPTQSFGQETNKQVLSTPHNNGVNGYDQSAHAQGVRQPSDGSIGQPGLFDQNGNSQHRVPSWPDKTSQQGPHVLTMKMSNLPTTLPQSNSGYEQSYHNSEDDINDYQVSSNQAPPMEFSDYNEFAWNLFRRADNNYGVIVCPIVLAYQLLLFKQFSQGKTKKELEHVLQSANREQIKRLVGETKDLTTTKLELANGVFYDSTVRINPDFKNVDGNFTHVEPFFAHKGSEIITIINRWTRQATHDEIKELLDPNFQISGVEMILASAMYFKGSWKYRFNTSDEYGTFQNYQNQEKHVPFMEIKNNILIDRQPYQIGDRRTYVQVVQLPYDDETHAMLLLIPVHKTVRIGDLRDEFTAAKFHEIVDSISQNAAQRVTLKMPKFSINSEISAVKALKAMGINRLFSEMTELEVGNRPLKVSEIMQRSLVRVDEIGTTAASVAASFLIPLSADSVANREIVIDRPFLSIIYNIKNNATLFISNVADV